MRLECIDGRQMKKDADLLNVIIGVDLFCPTINLRQHILLRLKLVNEKH